MIWCAILSIPFNFLNPPSVEDFDEYVIEKFCEKYNVTENGKDKLSENNDLDDAIEHITLGFISIKLFLTYIVYKLLIVIDFPCSKLIEIPINILQLIITLPIVFIVSYPIGFIYTKFWSEVIFNEKKMKL